MKKDDTNIKIVCAAIIAIIISSFLNAAASGTLFDSNEVTYDNAHSGINASDVQGAVDKLYAAATDYSDLRTDVDFLKTHVTSNATSRVSGLGIELNDTNGNTSYGGFIDFHFGGTTNDFTTRIIENSQGNLNIHTPNNTATVQVNGANVLTTNDFVASSFSVTPTSGYNYTNNTCYKIHRVVTCSLWINGLDATKFPSNAETIIGTVPSDYRPGYTVWGAIGIVGGEGNGNLYYKITSDGKITVSRKGSNAVSAILMSATWVK